MVPVVDEGKVECEVVGDGDGPLDGALVGAHHDAVLPPGDVLLDPLAEEGLHLQINNEDTKTTLTCIIK